MSRASRVALVLLGVGIMWVESRYSPAPGLGFGLALGCIAWAIIA